MHLHKSVENCNYFWFVIKLAIFLYFGIHSSSAQVNPLADYYKSYKNNEITYIFTDEGINDFKNLMVLRSRTELIEQVRKQYLTKKSERADILYLFEGLAYTITDKTDLAIQNLEKAKNTTKSLKVQLEAEIGIAAILSSHQEIDLAIQKLKGMIAQIENVKSDRLKTQIYLCYSHVLQKKGNHNESLKYLKKCLTYSIAREPNYMLSQMFCYLELGYLYIEMKDSTKSKHYFERAYELSNYILEVSDDVMSLSKTMALQCNAKHYYRNRQFQKAIGLFKKIAENYLAVKDYDHAIHSYRNIRKYYVDRKRYDSVYFLSVKMDSITKISFSGKSGITILETEAAFKSIQNQKKMHDISQQKRILNSQNNDLILLVITSVLTGSICILYVWKNKKKQIIKKESELAKSDLKLYASSIELKKSQHNIARKNEIIKKFDVHSNSSENQLQNKLIESLKSRALLTKKDTEDFLSEFEVIYPFFLENILKYFRSLSKNDRLIIAMTIIQISNEEQAHKLGISSKSLIVARYRLKNKHNEITTLTLNELIENKKEEYLLNEIDEFN